MHDRIDRNEVVRSHGERHEGHQAERDGDAARCPAADAAFRGDLRHLHGDAPPDPDGLLRAAQAVGVAKVVQIGCDVPAARWSVELARTRPDVIAGVAIHPNDAARLVERGRARARLDFFASPARVD